MDESSLGPKDHNENSESGETYFRDLEQSPNNIPKEFLSLDGLRAISSAWQNQLVSQEDYAKYENASQEYRSARDEIKKIPPDEEIAAELFEKFERLGEQVIKYSRLITHMPAWECPKFSQTQQEIVKLSIELDEYGRLIDNHINKGVKLNSDESISELQTTILPRLESKLAERLNGLTADGIREELLLDHLHHWADELNEAQKLLDGGTLSPDSRAEWERYRDSLGEKVDSISSQLDSLYDPNKE